MCFRFFVMYLEQVVKQRFGSFTKYSRPETLILLICKHAIQKYCRSGSRKKTPRTNC